MFRGIKSATAVVKRFGSSVQKVDYKLHTEDIPKNASIFSMIQPTGEFHLGNYLGATRVWKDLCTLKSSSQRLTFGVADLHAITIPKPNTTKFRKYRIEAIASILSVGVDPSKASVMYQSSIPQQTQLHWLLSTLASMGYLNRMTQWKSKSNIKDGSVDSDAIGKVRLGLFAYPVLQAADILTYKATHVPVGDDQTQHLELTRHLAEQFNHLYKKRVFPLPKTILAPTKKILSLSSPEKKMSKSDPNQDALIYLNDEPEIIAKKIKKAVTDSISDHFEYDPVNRPGVSNLINIISGIQRKSIGEVEKDIARFRNYSDFKGYVTENVVEELSGPRNMFKRFINEPEYLDSVIKKGSEEASEVAEKNIKEIMNIMGF
ncbi:hypothetical protein HG535_0H02560 [Zygotorulaspora mrakii]|uniref:Tryptophan--tRNA ligase, mitochondrial n=1 Tax=Zygotorulaspora mrakii TaxID=42260 RepID=A0A7H9BA84_ZYGMR|nr:uncharacterized protein HG535_0H02560 [Zygotorulaspora mrakii]QLG74929.1 hypothetical protein HG535_0H02560 [Zygotorulaspora mrakii]